MQKKNAVYLMQILLRMGGIKTMLLTEDAIKRSNEAKRELCNNIKNSLRGRVSEERLEKFEKDFYSITEGYLIERKHDRKKEK